MSGINYNDGYGAEVARAKITLASARSFCNEGILFAGVPA